MTEAPIPPSTVPWRSLAAGALLTALVCSAAMLWIDHPLAIAMDRYRDTSLVEGFRIVTLLANSTIWYVLALGGMAAAAIAARGQTSASAIALLRQRLRAASFLIISMVTSGLLINGIKLLLGRDRPKVFLRDGIETFHGVGQVLATSSFPSGHAQSISAAMIALAWIYPPLRFPGLVLALLVSASRVVIGAHYLSDIVAGMFFAVATAAIMRPLFERDGTRLDLSRTKIPSAA